MPEPNTVTAPPEGDPPPNPNTAAWPPPIAAGEPAPGSTVTRPVASTPGPGHPDRRTDADEVVCVPLPADDPSHLPDIPDFRIEAVIGHGGMGVVYRAVDLKLNRSVALKVIYPRGRDAISVRDRFEREVQSLAAIDHPNIVPVYHAGNWHGFPYFTMKLVPAGPLSRHLSRFTGNPAACALLVAKVARAVQTLHDRKVVHRDLKPLNILLGDGDEPLVADFGLAKWLDDADSEFSVTGFPVGTRQYMAPEQTLGRKDAITGAADIWALGVTLYELLAGRRPFSDADSTELFAQIQTAEHDPLPASVPADLAAVVAKCLVKEPRGRYPTAAAVADDLERWRRGEPVSVQLPESRPAPRRPRRRLLAAAVALAALVGAVAIWSAIQPAGDTTTDRGAAAPENPAAAPARPGVWRELLAREPSPLRWPDFPGNKKSHDPGQRDLHVTCGGVGLLGLGRTDAASYEFEITVRQDPWAGNVGVFFGYGRRALNGRPAETYQVVELTPVKAQGHATRFRLDWKANASIGPAGGDQEETSLVVGSSPEFQLPPGEQRVRVVVGAEGLSAVVWDGKPVPGLARAVALPPADERATCTGDFGVYVARGNGVFRDAKYLYHEDR
jgi:hypothetical protein